MKKAIILSLALVILLSPVQIRADVAEIQAQREALIQQLQELLIGLIAQLQEQIAVLQAVQASQQTQIEVQQVQLAGIVEPELTEEEINRQAKRDELIGQIEVINEQIYELDQEKAGKIADFTALGTGRTAYDEELQKRYLEDHSRRYNQLNNERHYLSLELALYPPID